MYRTHVKLASFCVLLFISSKGVAHGALRYVDAGATGTNAGTSWANAYTDLESALSDPLATEVWVAAAIYLPSARTNPSDARTATFSIPAGVQVYGGFVGTETLLAQRDPATNVTILNGDLNSNDGSNFSNYGENAYHVVTLSSADDTSRVDGFTITHGNADGGGGNPSSPLKFGGGVFDNPGATNGAARVVDCIISANKSEQRGGGIYVGSGVTDPGLRIETSTVSGNQSFNGGGAHSSGFLSFIGSILSANSTTGTSASYLGGAIYTSAGTLTIVDQSEVLGNSAGKGGGLYRQGSADVIVRETLLDSNTATAGVGGAVAWFNEPSGPGLLMVIAC